MSTDGGICVEVIVVDWVPRWLGPTADNMSQASVVRGLCSPLAWTDGVDDLCFAICERRPWFAVAAAVPMGASAVALGLACVNGFLAPGAMVLDVTLVRRSCDVRHIITA